MLELISKLNTFPLILASQSPRRQELLKNLGLQFSVISPSIDEDDHSLSHDPAEMVKELSIRKAVKVQSENPDAVIIAADTTVAYDGHVLNKPSDSKEAEKMLVLLSGKTHSVFTGFTVLFPGSIKRISKTAETKVRFSVLSNEEIKSYIQTGSPLDKAGAYGIQDSMMSAFISGIEGDYYNVMGFPVNAFYQELKPLLTSGKF